MNDREIKENLQTAHTLLDAVAAEIETRRDLDREGFLIWQGVHITTLSVCREMRHIEATLGSALRRRRKFRRQMRCGLYHRPPVRKAIAS